jgi:RHS repeat-associated protein
MLPERLKGGGWVGEPMEFFHQDALGSVRLVVNESGNIIRHDYLPFGEEIQPNTFGRTAELGYGFDPTPHRFTGKERDRESSLDYFGARYYSGAQGRFTSVDPENAGASEGNPQSWNAYSYALNNPLLYTDPTGLCSNMRSSDPNDPNSPLVCEETVEVKTTPVNLYDRSEFGMAVGVQMAYRAPATERLIWELMKFSMMNGVLQGAQMIVLPARGLTTLGALRPAVRLSAKTGAKLAQQIAKWRELGGVGGQKEFLKYAADLASEARAAGSMVSGQVGSGSGALGYATIYRRGGEFLVVQGGRIMSYVNKSEAGGIVAEYARLGGSL